MSFLKKTWQGIALPKKLFGRRKVKLQFGKVIDKL